MNIWQIIIVYIAVEFPYALVAGENTAQPYNKILPKRKTNKGRRNWIISKFEEICLN